MRGTVVDLWIWSVWLSRMYSADWQIYPPIRCKVMVTHNYLCGVVLISPLSEWAELKICMDLHSCKQPNDEFHFHVLKFLAWKIFGITYLSTNEIRSFACHVCIVLWKKITHCSKIRKHYHDFVRLHSCSSDRTSGLLSLSLCVLLYLHFSCSQICLGWYGRGNYSISIVFSVLCT